MFVPSMMSCTDFELSRDALFQYDQGSCIATEQSRLPAVYEAGSATAQEHRWGQNVGALGGPFDVIVACGKRCTLLCTSCGTNVTVMHGMLEQLRVASDCLDLDHVGFWLAASLSSYNSLQLVLSSWSSLLLYSDVCLQILILWIYTQGVCE